MASAADGKLWRYRQILGMSLGSRFAGNLGTVEFLLKKKTTQKNKKQKRSKIYV